MNREWQAIQAQQCELEALFSAWLNEKQQREIISFEDEQGNLVERYPDGTVKVLYVAT